MRVPLAGVVGVVLATHVAIAGPRPAPSPDLTGMPDPLDVGSPPPANDLDRSAIIAAMASIRSKVRDCGDELPVGGTLRAKVTVAPSGKVTSATAEGIDDPALQACVIKVMKTVRLPKSDNGGTFSFPFVFQATDMSDTLDAQIMDKGLAKLETKIAACHKAGTITMIRPQALKVDVNAAGKVTKVWTYGVSGDIKTDTCVERVFKAARFDKTTDGGAFNYPRRPVAANPVATASTSTGDLDRAAITDGVAQVKAKIVACGDASKLGGTVTAHVTVGADGKVTSATADGSTDAALDTCVANAIKTATFAKSKTGGAFAYPFVFGAPTPIDPVASSGTSGDLDRASISDGIARVKAKLVACGDRSIDGGMVKAQVTVGPDGKVTSVTVDGSVDASLNGCVAAVIKTTTFAKTKSGGAFSYPFVFGTPAPPQDRMSPIPRPLPASGLTESLDRAMISDGITKVKAAISACGDGKTKGVVKISVVVAPGGTVTSAKVTQTPGDALGVCVSTALSKATFAKTAQGGSFSYPFVF